MAVIIIIYWTATEYSLVDGHQCLRKICCFHHQSNDEGNRFVYKSVSINKTTQCHSPEEKKLLSGKGNSFYS
jgi:hypothetical protein